MIKSLALLFGIIVANYAANIQSEILLHLKDMEGFKTTGYFPTDQSGVTIGIGIDLGQHTQISGISSTIQNKIQKYLGLKTRAEVERKGLKASDLKLSVQEAEELSMVFIKDSINAVSQYTKNMNDKGFAVLVSLRHWNGFLSCSGGCKLSNLVNGKYVNYVWDAISGGAATNSQLKAALQATLKGKTQGTITFNRIQREIDYLS